MEDFNTTKKVYVLQTQSLSRIIVYIPETGRGVFMIPSKFLRNFPTTFQRLVLEDSVFYEGILRNFKDDVLYTPVVQSRHLESDDLGREISV